MRILLVEDSQRLRNTVARALVRLGQAVDEAADVREARQYRDLYSYDVILLDLMLPGESGLSFLESLRRNRDDTPVIILTALHTVGDRVRGLALGADDYLVKPFAIEELAARIEAVVRRRSGQAHSVLRIGALEIDFSARRVLRRGEEVSLTAREFSLLECLARHPGQVLSREQIEEHLYAETQSPLSNAVDAAIYALRRKLFPGDEPSLIHTRRGLGYVMQEKS